MTAVQLSRSKRIFFAATAAIMALTIVFTFAEVATRILEPNEEVLGDPIWVPHPVLGWLPTEGRRVHTTGEFTAVYDINSLGMNDQAIGDSVEQSEIRILALGDSHTFAVGVSQEETWPNVLEDMLSQGSAEQGHVYNLGMIGYSLGQYLLRMRQTIDLLRPKIVLVGFSAATDLYDLIPPRKGGFVYGEKFGRVYFDLDEKGSLLERHDLEGQTIELPEISRGLEMRRALGHLALYRRFKRSRLALWASMRFKPEGESLWPGMDTALAKDLKGENSYRWQLATRILHQIAVEAHEKGAEVMLVNIPYIAQVYDDVWASSFGNLPTRYDRWSPNRRLERICKEAGMYYADAMPRFIESGRRGVWLHYPHDAHPNPQGHREIAAAVLMALREQQLVPPGTGNYPASE